MADLGFDEQYSRVLDENDPMPVDGVAPAPVLLPDMITRCCNSARPLVCGKPASILCQACRMVRYCSEFCQLEDWTAGGHGGVCYYNSSPLRVERDALAVARDAALASAKQLIAKSDFTTAETILVQLARSFRDDADVLIEYGHALAARGGRARTARAEAVMRHAVSLESASAAHRAALAYFLHHAARMDDAAGLAAPAAHKAAEALEIYSALPIDATQSASVAGLTDVVYLWDMSQLMQTHGRQEQARAALAAALASPELGAAGEELAARLHCAYAAALMELHNMQHPTTRATATATATKATTKTTTMTVTDGDADYGALAAEAASAVPWSLLMGHYEAVMLRSPAAVSAQHGACCGAGLARALMARGDLSGARGVFERALDGGSRAPLHAAYGWVLLVGFADVAGAEHQFAIALAKMEPTERIAVARYYAEFLHDAKGDRSGALVALRTALLERPMDALDRACVADMLRLNRKYDIDEARARAISAAGPSRS